MSQREVNYEWLREAVADSLCIDAERVNLSTNLAREGADSLDLVELEVMIEEEFGLTFPDIAEYPATVKGWLDVIGDRPMLTPPVKAKRKRGAAEEIEPDFEKADALI